MGEFFANQLEAILRLGAWIGFNALGIFIYSKSKKGGQQVGCATSILLAIIFILAEVCLFFEFS